MDQQRARNLCQILLLTPPPLLSHLPTLLLAEHHYVQQGPETRPRALNKAAAESAAPYITGCFFPRAPGNNSCLARVNNS